MNKKRGLDDFETNLDEENEIMQRGRELYAEKADQIVNVYVCNDSVLKNLLKGKVANLAKTIKNLKNPRSIHKIHPHVRKTKQVLRFKFCPAKLGDGGRCMVRLTDVMSMVPKTSDEVLNMQLRNIDHLDTSRFVLHSFTVTAVRNPFLPLILRGNMFDATLEALQRHQNGERMLRAVSGREPLEMPDLPGEYGVMVLEQGMDSEVGGDVGLCVKPFGYIEPENARVALSTSDITNNNGIVWIDWQDPSSKKTERVGILAKEHVLTTAARANFDEYYIKTVALGDSVSESDNYWVIIPADLAKKVSDDFVERQEHAVPVCTTAAVLFEVCRQRGGTNWTSEDGLGEDPIDLSQTYEVVLEFEMEYTLLSSNVGKGVVTMPSASLPINVMETELELREAIDRQVAEKIEEEQNLFDFAKLREATQELDDN